MGVQLILPARVPVRLGGVNVWTTKHEHPIDILHFWRGKNINVWTAKHEYSTGILREHHLQQGFHFSKLTKFQDFSRFWVLCIKYLLKFVLSCYSLKKSGKEKFHQVARTLVSCEGSKGTGSARLQGVQRCKGTRGLSVQEHKGYKGTKVQGVWGCKGTRGVRVQEHKGYKGTKAQGVQGVHGCKGCEGCNGVRSTKV